MAIIKTAVTMEEGAGVTVKRLMPVAAWRNFDPFVLWDDFSIQPGNGFPDHPHRGFEAITYLFNGSIEHRDNLGNHTTVFAGGAQRFTAGSGLIHSEMPHAEGVTHGIQLWINLAKKNKGIAPTYQQVDDGQFPVAEIEGGRVKTIVGDGSPLRLMTPVRYLDVTLRAGTRFLPVLPPRFRGFYYVVDGAIRWGETTINSGQACFFEQDGPPQIDATEESRILVCSGQPHGEPIYQHGPYVD